MEWNGWMGSNEIRVGGWYFGRSALAKGMQGGGLYGCSWK